MTRPDRAPRDPRIDRAIAWLVGLGFVGWSGLLWTRYDTLGDGQEKLLAAHQALIAELAGLRTDLQVSSAERHAHVHELRQHKELSFHPNADRIIFRQLEIVSQLRERVDRLEAHMMHSQAEVEPSQ